jgi:MauM/NapG family ferredoxin protein
MIASGTIIVNMLLAIILVILTLIFGRFFCGYICPLGTFIDFCNIILFKKPKKKEKPYPKPNRNIKYFILTGVVAGSLLGANVLHFFSPMSIFPRVFTLVIFPPIIRFLNLLLDISRPLNSALGIDPLAHYSFNPLYFSGTTITFILILSIIAANYWRKRFWCRYICPTGALLSLFSRFAVIKRKVNKEKCNDCMLCASSCDMRAIKEHPQETVLSECTLCASCEKACNRKVNSIGFTNFGFGGDDAKLTVTRRKFIYSTATGIIGASALKAGIHNKKDINGRLIRPPGSLPEQDFLSQCIRCGECMKVCKTNGLQPSGLDSGLDTLWTPRLIPRLGACEDKCNMCGYVCPTRAIRQLPLKEKLFVKIGTAVIDRHRCIAWEQNLLCLICDEICPYDAIEFRVVTSFTGSFKRPFVIEEKCTGCGWCEHKCPVAGRGAIEVYSIGADRISRGSYITEKKKKLREITENSETSYDVEALGSGGEKINLLPKPSEDFKIQKKEEDEELPGGFILEE